MKKHYIWKGIKFTLFIALAIFAFGSVVMALWNWLIPDIFQGPHINFPQALGLLVLSKILFGGFKGKWGGHHCQCGNNMHWKERLRAKFEHLSPEEKEKMKEKFNQSCWNTSNTSKNEEI